MATSFIHSLRPDGSDHLLFLVYVRNVRTEQACRRLAANRRTDGPGASPLLPDRAAPSCGARSRDLLAGSSSVGPLPDIPEWNKMPDIRDVVVRSVRKGYRPARASKLTGPAPKYVIISAPPSIARFLRNMPCCICAISGGAAQKLCIISVTGTRNSTSIHAPMRAR